MNSEESRLRTFANWPENAVVDARRIATAGFYYMGQGQEVQCFSCGGRISEWNIGDSVMGRHRSLDPNCPFVQNPVLSANIPLLCDSQSRNSPNTSQNNRLLFYDERARLESFANWPSRSIVSPELLAKSGFYYLNQRDLVRCYYCNQVIMEWVAGDDPDTEHLRYSPNCSFIKSKNLAAAMNVTYHSGVNIRQTSTDHCENALKDLGVQDHRVPKHPKFSTYDSRLNTFSQWPPSLNQKPSDMAEAGFYFTGGGDQVRCFHCDGGLRMWEREDDPWLEHARWFPGCGFILLVKGQEFVDEANTIKSQLTRLMNPKTRGESPIRRVASVTEQELQELMSSPNALAALQMGIDSSRIKQALRHRMEYTGVPFTTPDSLVVAALEVQTEQISVSECDDWATPPDSPSSVRWINARRADRISTHASVSSDSESDGECMEAFTEEPEQRPRSPVPPPPPPKQPPPKEEAPPAAVDGQVVPLSLEEENRRLKEARLCKICMDLEVVIVFLPCRHLVTCPNCAPSLTDCPLCREPIRATVRTFLS